MKRSQKDEVLQEETEIYAAEETSEEEKRPEKAEEI